MAKRLYSCSWFPCFLGLKVIVGHWELGSLTSNNGDVIQVWRALNVTYVRENPWPWLGNQTGYTSVLPGWLTDLDSEMDLRLLQVTCGHFGFFGCFCLFVFIQSKCLSEGRISWHIYWAFSTSERSPHSIPALCCSDKLHSAPTVIRCPSGKIWNSERSSRFLDNDNWWLRGFSFPKSRGCSTLEDSRTIFITYALICSPVEFKEWVPGGLLSSPGSRFVMLTWLSEGVPEWKTFWWVA